MKCIIKHVPVKKANQRDLIAATGLVILNCIQIVDLSANKTLDHDFEAIGQLLYPAAGSNQVGCGCTW